MNTLEKEGRSSRDRRQWCVTEFDRLAGGDGDPGEEIMGSVIRAIVRSLRSGSVVTYRDISRKVYCHNWGTRGVAGAIKYGAKDPEFPWWRVVNKTRFPPREKKGARKKLEDEGVEFCKDGSVDPGYYDPEQICGLTALVVAILGVLCSEISSIRDQVESLRDDVKANTDKLASIAAILDERLPRNE